MQYASNYYTAPFIRTAIAADAASRLVYRKGRRDVYRTRRALTSDRAIWVYGRIYAILYILALLAFALGTLARESVDAYVTRCNTVPDVDIDMSEVLAELDSILAEDTTPNTNSDSHLPDPWEQPIDDADAELAFWCAKAASRTHRAPAPILALPPAPDFRKLGVRELRQLANHRYGITGAARMQKAQLLAKLTA